MQQNVGFFLATSQSSSWKCSSLNT